MRVSKFKMLGVFIAMVALIMLPSLTRAQNDQQANCPYTDGAWVETRMYLGLSKPSGAAVSRREWDEFVSNHFVVRFPHGFTIIETTGYWQDNETKATVYENGRQVIILHKATPANETAINEIAEQYRNRFDQQSVLVSSNTTRVRFCDGS